MSPVSPSKPARDLRKTQKGVFNPQCFFAVYGSYERGEMPPCEGQLRKCHLIPKQVLLRELPSEDSGLIWHSAVWVWGCGGSGGFGSSGHHGAVDTARTIRIPWDAIPHQTKEFAEKHGLTWWLEREYSD